MTRTTATYLAAVEQGGQRILEVAAGRLDQPVPSCPGWDIGRLAGHVGRVYHSIGETIRRRATEAVPAEEIPRAPEGDAVLDWLAEAHRNVLEALRGIGADEPVWTWAGEPNGAFYHRRMAHETTVHRWDAEHAVGEAATIDASLAADGLDELFDVLHPSTVRRFGSELPIGSLHLHQTDGDGEWLLRVENDRIVATHEHAKGDAAVRGAAQDLLLLQWERASAEDPGFEVFGDADVISSWTALSR